MYQRSTDTESFFRDPEKAVSEAARTHERVLIERDGEPLIALISPQDLARLRAWDESLDALGKSMDAMSVRFADVPDDVLEAEIEQAKRRVRAQRRADASTS